MFFSPTLANYNVLDPKHNKGVRSDTLICADSEIIKEIKTKRLRSWRQMAFQLMRAR